MRGSWEVESSQDPDKKQKFYINVCGSLDFTSGPRCSPYASACVTSIDKDGKVMLIFFVFRFLKIPPKQKTSFILCFCCSTQLKSLLGFPVCLQETLLHANLGKFELPPMIEKSIHGVKLVYTNGNTCTDDTGKPNRFNTTIHFACVAGKVVGKLG